MQKINIKLSPHDAIVISAFLSEFKKEFAEHPECESLRTACENYFNAMVKAIPDNALEDAHAEIEVNILLGKSPDRPNRK